MDGDRQTLEDELHTVDTALGFLLLILVSVLLSCAATARQRQALCLALRGGGDAAQAVGEVYPLRLGAAALVVGALGYFFTLALETWQSAASGDPAARRSAWMNLAAAFLVLLAALVRLFDLNFVRRAQPALAGELLPD